MTDKPISTEAREPDAPPDGEPLDRMPFKELGPIAGEPETDVLIETESGLSLRERIVETAANAETALAADASPTARSFAISNALLDPDGSVATDDNGKPRLASRHEVVFTNETLGRLGSIEAVQEAMTDARQIAVAQADMEFRGMRLHDQLVATNLRGKPTGAA